jgi:hypothetical protein
MSILKVLIMDAPWINVKCRVINAPLRFNGYFPGGYKIGTWKHGICMLAVVDKKIEVIYFM